MFRKLVFGLIFTTVTMLTIGAGPAGLSGAERTPNPATAAEDLRLFCSGLWVHDGVAHKNLVVFPVSHREVRDTTGYTTLDEAIESGLVKITETDSGSVPTLRLEIRSSEPMLFMAGEVVTGAKQDRILKHDLLFRGFKGSLDLPVYCVEQGRWTSVSDEFGAGKTLGSAGVRKSAVMKEGQSVVWDKVRSKNADVSAETATDTFQASYNSEQFRKAESGYMDKLRDLPSMHDGRVAGVVITIGGKVVSADLFANPQIFRKLWPKVLKAAILDAVSTGEGTVANNSAAREFLGAAAKATVGNQENPSQGQEFSLSSDSAQGSFITSRDGVVHLALFAGDLSEKRPEIEQREENPIQIQQRQPGS